MDVTIGSAIHIREPSPDLMKWANKELTLPNPEYARRLQMGLWTGKTPQTLILYEMRGDTLVLPYGTLSWILPYIKGAKIRSDFQEPPFVDFGGSPVPLYDYQQDAVAAMVQAKYGILKSAAGSGKTQMGIALAKAFARPTLWLTHTKDLLNQSKERAERYIDSRLIGTISEGKVSIGKGITFATVQTMCKLDLDLYRDCWDVVICDEVHRAASSPTSVTMFGRVLNHLCARHKYGLTATVHRSDGLIKSTLALIGPVQYEVPDEAVADRIMKVTIHPVATPITISEECLNEDGTLNYTRLVNYLTSDEDRNDLILDDIIANGSHPSLILSDRLEQLQMLMDSLPDELRSQAVMISGKMVSKAGKAEREAALADMRSGKKRFLFATYSLSKEGLDIPRLERLYMASPVKDEAVVIQAVGRIARTSEGKQQPVVYDYIDNIRYCQRAFKERCRHYHKIGASIE